MKLYSNKVFLFTDFQGLEFKAPQGFCTAPDWVGKTDLFNDAIKEGSLKLVEGSTFSEGEKKLAEADKAALEAKIAELEAKLKEKEKGLEGEEGTGLAENTETPSETNDAEVAEFNELVEENKKKKK